MRELPEPEGFRTRYRSEPGMIGHYPWTYADQRRRRADRPEHESEDLFTRDQVLAIQKQAYEDGLRDAGKDAERYRWLRDRKSLELRSDCGKWTRIDGSTFIASHFLAEGGTQHSAAPSLDETIDSAMLVAMLTASQKEQKPQKRHACDDPLCAVCGNPL